MDSKDLPVEMQLTGLGEFALQDHMGAESSTLYTESTAGRTLTSVASSSTFSEVSSIGATNRLHIDVVTEANDRTRQHRLERLMGERKTVSSALTKEEVETLKLPHAHRTQDMPQTKLRAEVYPDQEDMLEQRRKLKENICKLRKQNDKMRRYSEEISSAIREQKRVVAILARGKGLLDNDRIRAIVNGDPDFDLEDTAEDEANSKTTITPSARKKLVSLNAKALEYRRTKRCLQRRYEELKGMIESEQKQIRRELVPLPVSTENQEIDLGQALEDALAHVSEETRSIRATIEDQKREDNVDKASRDAQIEHLLTRQEQLERRLRRSRSELQRLARQNSSQTQIEQRLHLMS